MENLNNRLVFLTLIPSGWLSGAIGICATPWLIFLLIIIPQICLSQNAVIREVSRQMTTYPYSDPDPVPRPGRVYPYFRYDGFTNNSVKQEWKTIELENDFIRLTVLPEMGGKVWDAVEKSENYPFVFTTKAIKFRDIALRGPWTTGGLEFNFGDIGHGTTVSAPVDYFTRKNDDGSVSCFIGATDWSSRTTWRIEVKLSPDKAFFTTRAWWYNNTPVEQEYYHWVNAGFKTEGDLEFIFPGTYHIGHGGEKDTWPLDSMGRNLSFYRNNNFGSYKSYHIIGQPSSFYGGFWHDDNMGFGRYSPYYEKLGKKVWILGLSQEGERWENLLGDNDGLNVEMQSGRLFNQASSGSERTPFDHVGFAPYSADTWSDKWFPVKHTRGMTHASERGALNLRKEGEWLKIDLMPLEYLSDSLFISHEGKNLITRYLVMKPMELFRDSVKWNGNTGSVTARLGHSILTEESGSELNRPVESPKDFNWDSDYGLLVKGTDLSRQKNYRDAESYLLKALAKNPGLTPALAKMAEIRYRQGLYEESRQYAGKALAINAYDPDANYFWGLSSEQTGFLQDAFDGYSVAAISPATRRIANIKLAWLEIGRKDWALAEKLVMKCLENYPPDELGYNMQSLIKRRQGKTDEAHGIITQQLERDPLNHISRFERFMCTQSETDKKEFISNIRQELPHETFIELALQYHNWNLDDESVQILRMAPQHPLVQLFLAYLLDKKGLKDDAEKILAAAAASSPELVLPFRPEMIGMLDWADKSKPDWKWKYYEALTLWQLNRTSEAQKLFESCGNEPAFAPFWIAKADLFRDQTETAKKSLEKAYQLDPGSWRTALRLSRFYASENMPGEALDIAAKNYISHSGSFIVGLQYAQMLKLNRKYPEALKVLSGLEMLPAEGDVNAHTLYRETNILYAMEFMKSGKWKKAVLSLNQSELWPENLFSGEPYYPDNRVTQFLRSYCFEKLKIPAESEKSFKYIREYRNPDGRTYTSGNRLTDALKTDSKDFKTITVSVLKDLKNDRDKEVLEAFAAIL